MAMHANVLNLILGPVAAGKTTEGLRRWHRATAVGIRVHCVRPTFDTRSPSDQIETHDGVRADCRVLASAAALHTVLGLGLEPTMIIVDEIQFWDESLTQWVNEMLHPDSPVRGLTILGLGLSGNFARKPWTRVSELIPLASEIAHKTALCTVCKCEAAFSSRLSSATEHVLQGGTELYAPRCAAHWSCVE